MHALQGTIWQVGGREQTDAVIASWPGMVILPFIILPFHSINELPIKRQGKTLVRGHYGFIILCMYKNLEHFS